MIGCSCETCSSTDSKDKRLRTSLHLSLQDCEIQIDIGPDFRQQMLNSKIPRVDLILITHQHADHTAGLDEVRALNFLQNSSIPLFAEKNVLEDLRTRFAYIFGKNKYPGLPIISLNEIQAYEKFIFNSIEILPIRIMHGSLPILAYRIGKFAYITDANFIEDRSIELLQDLDVLVINALRHKTHHSHFNLDQSLEVANRIHAKKTFLTHLSHQMGLHKKVEKQIPDTVAIAYDGLEVYIDE